MTTKEYEVANAQCALRDAESKLNEAIFNYEHGGRVEAAKLDQAKAAFDREVLRLKEDLRRAETQLTRQKGWLAFAQAELARGYEA